MRGQASDYDSWAALGNAGWSYADVLPYFRRSETNENGGDEYRGGDGPLRTSNLRSSHPLAEKFVQAAIATGLPANDDFNGRTQEGAGFVQANQIFGRRHSAADAYLKPIRGRKNLHIRTKAQVSRVLIEDRMCDRDRVLSARQFTPCGSRAPRGHPVGRHDRIAAIADALGRW